MLEPTHHVQLEHFRAVARIGLIIHELHRTKGLAWPELEAPLHQHQTWVPVHPIHEVLCECLECEPDVLDLVNPIELDCEWVLLTEDSRHIKTEESSLHSLPIGLPIDVREGDGLPG